MVLCVQCDKYFGDDRAFIQHAQALGGHPYCAQCNSYFCGPFDLALHRQLSDHPYCSQCDRYFVSAMALSRHRTDRSDHHYCEDCERSFVSNEALWQHIRYSPVHQDVDYPDTESEDPESEDDDDEDDTYCRVCNRYFDNVHNCTQHRRAKHNWCSTCDRFFSTPEALAQHNSSPVHKPRTHKCPLCNSYYKVPSATAHHLESGACHGCTRHHLRDVWKASSLAQLSHMAMPTSAFNGKGYQCFICSKTCRTLDGLNQHLNSAAHDEDEFKCPKCDREFAVISALIQHIENETCGIARMAQVERIANDLAAQFSRTLRF